MHPPSPDPLPAPVPAPPPADRRRRALLQAAGATAAAAAAPGLAWATAATRKVLRVAFQIAETSFDPSRISDLYSRAVTAHIFEALYAYDPLARPSKIVPLVADGLPQVSDDYRVWTVRVRPGIYFADDPAFQGRRREMTAEDHAYVFRRVMDPAYNSPLAESLQGDGIVGLAELRAQALKTRTPFDYDAPVAGLRVLDRYTLQFTLAEPRPRFLQTLAQSELLGAQAREVVAFYGDRIDAHPVGTGPFQLQQWRRGSLIVLVRNPGYRERVYAAEPAADDAEGQAILQRFKGRRLPMVDEVRVAIIEENQPRWLAFLNGQLDGLLGQTGPLPLDYAPLALPGGRIAPHLARRGIRALRNRAADCAFTYYNLRDPVLGGYTPEKVALRRALSLATDVAREIRLVRRGQAVVAQSPLLPHTSGYDPAFRSEMGVYDLARARALLDLHGYIDRNGDGWRERPDGGPLELVQASEPSQISRQFDELTLRNSQALGVKVRIATRQWPENMKAAQAGSLQMWTLGTSADSADGQGALARYYSKQAGQQNLAQFNLPAFDALYERMLGLPDGPEREQLFLQAKRLAVAYMPQKINVHRISNDLLHPWLLGFRRPVFASEWWHLVDIDTGLAPPA